MRLIDADAFEVVTYKGTETFSDCFDNGVLYILNELDKAPTVDAEPVRHGHWITHNEGNPFEIYGECSICGCSQSISDHLNYCPDCGAKMDGERKENT